MRGRCRLIAGILVASASMGVVMFSTPEAHSSPCQKLRVWNPATDECRPPPSPRPATLGRPMPPRPSWGQPWTPA